MNETANTESHRKQECWTATATPGIYKRTGPRGVAYLVRVDLPPDPITGQRRRPSKTCRSLKEAKAELGRWRSEIDTGTALEPSKLSVGGLLEAWLADVAAHRVKPTMLEDYAATIRKLLTPALGSLSVQKLNAAQVQAFYSARLAAGSSPRTVQLCHLRLSQALAQAVRWGVVPRNVCDAVTAPRVEYKRPEPWTVEEARRFLDAAADDGLSPLWTLAVTTGARRGELLGVRWRDLDLDTARLQIAQTVTTLDGAAVLDTPKTRAALRTIKLPAEAVDLLREHRKQWAARKLAAGPAWHDHDLVVCTADGKPVHPSNVGRSFQRLSKAAGVRRVRFHDLRHAHATWLLGGGLPVPVVSARLGHARASITLDTYAHVLPHMQDAAVDALGAMLAATKSA